MLSAATMTAERQEASPLRPGIALIGLLVCMLSGIWILCAGVPAQAATTERIVVNRFSGVAIEGFDPVAYFVAGEAVQGTAEFEANLWGAVWRFRNEGNRASFLAHPEVYGPQFGGYDPVDIARGVIIAGNPRFFAIAAQRLYLFSRERQPRALPLRGGQALAGPPGQAQPVGAFTTSESCRLWVTPGDELRDDEAAIVPLAEAERAALAVGYAAAGCGHDRVAGPDVPFTSGPEAGIDVGTAFRDPAEFHGRADRLSDGVGAVIDEGLGSGISMRAAHRGDPWLAQGRQLAGMDRLGSADRRAVEPDALGAAADDAAPEQPECGRADDAQQRHARCHQGKVDG